MQEVIKGINQKMVFEVLLSASSGQDAGSAWSASSGRGMLVAWGAIVRVGVLSSWDVSRVWVAVF